MQREASGAAREQEEEDDDDEHFPIHRIQTAVILWKINSSILPLPSYLSELLEIGIPRSKKLETRVPRKKLEV